MVRTTPKSESPNIKNMENQYNKLTKEEERVIINKGTEIPFSGKYYKHKEKGVYTCKRCGAELYKSDDKFDSSCGWPTGEGFKC